MAKDEKEKELDPEKELEEINKVLSELDLDSDGTVGGADSFVSVSQKKPVKPSQEPPVASPPKEAPLEEPLVVPPPEEAPVASPPEEAPPEEPPVVPPPEEAPFSEDKVPSTEKSISDELSFLDQLDSAAPPVSPPSEEIPPPETPLTGEPEIQEVIPPPEEPEIQEVIPPFEEPPVQKDKGIELTDDQVLQIHKRISTFKGQLKKVTTRVIVNEELPSEDLMVLFDHLLSGEKPAAIRSFLEQKLNIAIKEGPVIPLAKGPAKLKPSFFDVISHDFIPIIRLAIPVLAGLILLGWLVINPLLKKGSAGRLIKKGVELIHTDKSQNFTKAEEKFKQALAIKKNYYEAYLEYGDAYSDVNKFDKAEKKYKELLQIDEDYKASYLKLGDLYDKQELYDAAIAEYNKVLEIDKNDITALDKKAKIYYDKKKEPEKSRQIYQDIIDKEPKNIKAHYGILSIHIKNNDLDSIEKEHYQVLSLGKKYKDLEKLTALAAFYIDHKTDIAAKKEDLYNKAEDTLNRVLVEDRKYSEAYFQYARLHRSRRDYRNSQAAIENAIKYDEKQVKYYNFLGEIFLIGKKINLAIEQFEEGRGIDPSFTKILYNLGNINYYELDNYGEAKELYVNAVKDKELSDEYYDLNYNLGWLFYKDYDLENANKFFNKARELYKKDNPYISFALGNTYLKLGRYDLASGEYLDIIDQFKEKYGEYPKVNAGNNEMVDAMKLLSAVYNNLGVCKINSYDEKKALVYFWKAVESAKKLGFANENSSARANIQYVLQGKNKIISDPEMYDELKKVLAKDPYGTIPF
ncbi:MAG: tetratricopeptide repeat protein [Spirochaetes bacterium]|nr:tetratricopeptide repeat protein [Spirochaetota bacterium]